MESIDFTGVYKTFADALTKRFAEQKKPTAQKRPARPQKPAKPNNK